MVLRYGTDHATGKTTDEVRYFTSSLPAQVQRLARAVRQHWGIETGLHGVLVPVRYKDTCSDVTAGCHWEIPRKTDHISSIIPEQMLPYRTDS
jgi:predicted transposase YbfD/YdcC